jgi:putative SOS response-associated peptidase YedK
MCGRYSETKPLSEIQKVYPFKLDSSFEPSYNLAPSQPGLVITADVPDLIKVMNFGLVPFWAKDKKVGFSMINARSESLLEKPAFKPLLLQNKRCLVLADGFYEWEKVGKEKLPYGLCFQIVKYLLLLGYGADGKIQLPKNRMNLLPSLLLHLMTWLNLSTTVCQ